MVEEKTLNYQLKPYRSFEQKIFVDSGIRDFLAYFGKGFCGAVVSMYRLPTFARKIVNKQTFLQREGFLNDSPWKSSKSLGAAWGISVGFVADALLLGYCGHSVYNENYFPLTVLGATNLAFLAFELGRASKSKQEHLEMKAKLEAKKARENLEAEVQTPQISETQDEATSGGGG